MSNAQAFIESIWEACTLGVPLWCEPSVLSQRDRRGDAQRGITGMWWTWGDSGSSVFDKQGRVQAPIEPSVGSHAMPGPFPGRVVEVGHAGSVHDGRRDAKVVKSMVDHGMQQLVPDAESSVDAWRYFFQPGDRVGIKVVPVGMAVKPGRNSGSRRGSAATRFHFQLRIGSRGGQRPGVGGSKTFRHIGV